jgi:uncharacterized protein YndB with AHSA1/START domain
MTGFSVLHDTFTIERSYLAIPARVFAAFATTDAKDSWATTGGHEAAEATGVPVEFEFRIGGRERFGFTRSGTIYRYDARYYDIVPDQRIIYSYEMYAGDTRISVSVTTIQFATNGDGTALSWTEQGAFPDGHDEAPGLRLAGTTALIDHLPEYLNLGASS